jgi:hypothetical protein
MSNCHAKLTSNRTCHVSNFAHAMSAILNVCVACRSADFVYVIYIVEYIYLPCMFSLIDMFTKMSQVKCSKNPCIWS